MTSTNKKPMKIMVCGIEEKVLYRHAVKNMGQIQRALEKYIDNDEYGYRKVFFIAAPTGAGKTTMIEQTVFTRASRETKILYVSSRVAINVQLKRRLLQTANSADEPERYTDAGIMKTETLGDITVLTYAGLYRKMISGVKLENEYEIVCFDEPQALYTDATFSGYTGFVLDNLRGVFASSKKICLTATPDDILPLLAERFNDYQVHVYKLKTTNDYVNLFLFHNENCVLGEIKSDKTENKWLIFDPSILHGQKIQHALSGEICMLNTVEREKNPDRWIEVCRAEKFQEKVCITTAVVDAGVNFKDDKLKNIVIFGHDKTLIQQVLGRKRRKAGERVNLYLSCPLGEELQFLIRNVNAQLDAIELHDKDYSMFVERHIIAPDALDLRRFIRVREQGQLEINWLAKLNLENQRKLYTKLLERTQKYGESAYEDYIAKILDITLGTAQDLWLDRRYNGDAAREFVDFLEENLDYEMDEQSLKIFSKDFCDKCIAAYGKNGPKDRDDRQWKDRKINNKLKELGLQYHLEKNQKGYVLRTGVPQSCREVCEDDGE